MCKYAYYLTMDINKIRQLTSNKDKRVTMMFNDELWNMFKKACDEQGTKPTPMFENFILSYLEEKGLL